MLAAVSPFHGWVCACHMMTLSFATAALMFTEGTPRNECRIRGFVQPLSTPSEGFRKWPVTRVFLYLERCFDVRGIGKALLSTYAWTLSRQKLSGRETQTLATRSLFFASSAVMHTFSRGLRRRTPRFLSASACVRKEAFLSMPVFLEMSS